MSAAGGAGSAENKQINQLLMSCVATLRRLLRSVQRYEVTRQLNPSQRFDVDLMPSSPRFSACSISCITVEQRANGQAEAHAQQGVRPQGVACIFSLNLPY